MRLVKYKGTDFINIPDGLLDGVTEIVLIEHPAMRILRESMKYVPKIKFECFEEMKARR